MESLNPFLSRMIRLTELKSRVDEFAALCCPDIVQDDNNTHKLHFDVLRGEEITGNALDDDFVVLCLNDDNKETGRHLFTKWSRSQLLTHLGAREKWFNSVSKDQQAREFNERIHTFEGHMLRTMKTIDAGDIRICRGFVSGRYSDIPDTTIMEDLCRIMPKAWACATRSGKTDRSLYAYIITGEKIGLPGAPEMFPGVIVRNSEVGYSSLWVTPMLYFPERGAWASIEKLSVLRKVHRGDVDLVGCFRQALDDANALWGDLDTRMEKLSNIVYVDEDTAVAAMRKMINKARGTKHCTYRCEQIYRGAQHPTHSGDLILDAVLTYAGHTADKDQGYAHDAIVGAVLAELVDW